RHEPSLLHIPYTTLFRSSTAGGLVGRLDLAGEHLALNRGAREQHDHGVCRFDPTLDLPRPFETDRDVPVDQHLMAKASEARLQRSEEHTSELQSRLELVC